MATTTLDRCLYYWRRCLTPSPIIKERASKCSLLERPAPYYVRSKTLTSTVLSHAKVNHSMASACMSHEGNFLIKTAGNPRPVVVHSFSRYLSSVQMSGEETRKETIPTTTSDSSATADSIDTSNGAASKNKAKNDAKRAAKMEKFLAKQSKVEQFKKDPASGAAAPKPKTLDINKKSNDVVITSTPAGEKKDMSQPMANAYDPLQVESSWYSWWEKKGFFKPECYGSLDEKREKFTIVMPPPNVTGSLHLGHATMLSIEDALVRWYSLSDASSFYD